MKVVYIQSSYTPNDLIGSWFKETRSYCLKTGGDAWIAVKYCHKSVFDENTILIGNSISCGVHNRMFEYWGLQDMFSYCATLRFLKELDIISPDIIHCNIINDQFLNLSLLVNYVNDHNIKVVWTFHDARVLTGQCPYPAYSACEQWKKSCKRCPDDKSVIRPSKRWANWVNIVHEYRKKTIGHIRNLTIVTPSNWLGKLVSESYLMEKKCRTINNGINHSFFRNVGNGFRIDNGIDSSRIVLLFVGNPLGTLKGREYIHRLIEDLSNKYVFVLAGCLQEDINKYKGNSRVYAFSRVNKEKLVELYSSADILVNPTLADNFPTVNLEAQSCGCPVIAFDTNGTPETVGPEGKVVPSGDYEALRNAIISFSLTGTREEAIVFSERFDTRKCIDDYIHLYEEVLRES